MKNAQIFAIALMALFLSSCTNLISNYDVQKLSKSAAVLLEKGEYQSAIGRLESINELSPNLAANHYNLGIAYYKNQEQKKAIESYRQAIKLDKRLIDAYYSIAIAYNDIADIKIEKLKKSNKKDIDFTIKILNDLHLASDNFAIYLESVPSESEKEKIVLQLDSLNKNIEKFESILLSFKEKN